MQRRRRVAATRSRRELPRSAAVRAKVRPFLTSHGRCERVGALGASPLPPVHAPTLAGVWRRRRIAPPRGPRTPATPNCRRRAHWPRCVARSPPALSACLPAPRIAAPTSSRPRPWSAAAATLSAPAPVHHGPVDPRAPPVHSTVPWTGHSRAATWPGRPRPPRAPGLFAKKPPRFFKINRRSNAVIVSFKICPCFYSLGPAPVGFYIFNPNLFLIQF